MHILADEVCTFYLPNRGRNVKYGKSNLKVLNIVSCLNQVQEVFLKQQKTFTELCPLLVFDA